MRILVVFLVFLMLSTSVVIPAFSQQVTGSRTTYIYDRANILSPEYRSLIDNYLRKIDASTSAEIIIYTIPSFSGHGIKNDGQEINDRDMMANYIFNEVPLDGITGIGKKGKDNGVLILLSLKRDGANGSMRIEIGKGLEGSITDGTAGAILDSYLVPARDEYENTRDSKVFDQAFLDTVIALGDKIGYVDNDPRYQQSRPLPSENELDYSQIALLLIFIVAPLVFSILARRRRRFGGGFFGGGYGGGFRGGGGFGGGGRSGGGGAGR